MTDPNTPAPAPGWYPAPHAGNELRYWDGAAWQEPAQAAAPTMAPPEEQTPQKPKKKIKWWGWLLIGLAALVVLIGVIGSLNRPDSDDVAAAPDTGQTDVADDPEEEAPEEEPVADPEPEPEPEPEPDVVRQELSGSGSDVLDVDITSAATVTFTCNPCEGNTVLKSNGGESLLVNEIGSYTGVRVINVSDGSITTRFTVEAEGAWTLVVDDIINAPRFDAAATGKGDAVFWMTSDFEVVEVRNEGESNFVVYAYGTDQWSPLIVNEIGSWAGTVEMSGPALVEVTSGGTWSLTPR